MIKQQAHFCHRLKKARRDARLKQEQVAAHLQIPVSAVSAFESGKRRLDAFELYQLSRLYQKPLAWFFSDHGMERQADAILAELFLDDPILLECFRLMKQAPKRLRHNAAYGVIGFLSDR